MFLESKKISPEEPPPEKRNGFFLALPVVLTLALGAGIYLAPEFWNHNSEYQWSVLWHGRKSWALWIFLSWSLVLGASYFLWRFFSQRLSSRGLNLFSAMLIFFLGILSQVLFTQIDRYGVYELLVRVLVRDHTGYFTDALRFKNKQELIETYLTNWHSLQTHSRTHPPGVVLVFMSLNQFAKGSGMVKQFYQALVSADVQEQIKKHFGVKEEEQAGALLALLLMLFSAGGTAVLGYFLLGKFYFQDNAFCASLMLISLPAFSHKAPVMDHFFGMMILLASMLALLCQDRSLRVKIWLWFISGIIIGTGLWLSPGFWSAVLLIPLLLVAMIKNKQANLPFIKVIRVVFSAELIIILGIIFALLLGSILLGASWLEIHKINRLGWHFNNTISGRITMWKWILFNPYEFFFFASFPLLYGFCLKAYTILKKLIFAPSTKEPSNDYFFWASIAFLFILNLSGQVCYESPRLCWFCLPLVSGLAVDGFKKTVKNFHNFNFFIILVLVIFQTVILRIIY